MSLNLEPPKAAMWGMADLGVYLTPKHLLGIIIQIKDQVMN